MTNSPNRPVKTVETAAEILRTLEGADGMALTEIAERIGNAESTTHRHLETLEHNEFVIKEAGQYRLSYRFLDFGTKLRLNDPLFDVGREYADQLAEETNERVWLSTIENGYGVSLYWASTRPPLNHHSRVGSRHLLHNNANGKAMLAELPDERVATILQRRGLPAKTEQTITDEDTLMEELATVSERGYAVSSGENFEGMSSVAVPIKVESAGVLGAMGIGFSPNSQASSERERFVRLLKDVTDEISIRIRVE